ncbi:MAG: hypothetical protein AAGG51_29535 [Cyanobacteria bacterium P01_G01_bin.54]
MNIALGWNISLDGEAELHHCALALARQFERPATYDFHYLVLAEQLAAEFWSSNRRLIQFVQPTFTWSYLVEAQ